MLLVDREDERAAEDVGRVARVDRTARERLVDVGDLLLERGDLLSVGLRERRASALASRERAWARRRRARRRVGRGSPGVSLQCEAARERGRPYQSSHFLSGR